jgi:hypothetical protein
MNDISLFDNIKTTSHPTKLSVDTFIKYIKDGKWKKEVEEVREKLSTERRHKRSTPKCNNVWIF